MHRASDQIWIEFGTAFMLRHVLQAGSLKLWILTTRQTYHPFVAATM